MNEPHEDNAAADFLGGGGQADGRQLTPEQRLMAAVLHDAVENLKRAPGCFRHKLAAAWVTGKYPCGCRYEGDAITVSAVADALGVDDGWLRRTTEAWMGRRDERRGRRRTAADCRQMVFPWLYGRRRRKRLAEALANGEQYRTGANAPAA